MSTPQAAASPVLQTALEYAKRGRPVLPLTPEEKTPLYELVPHGKNNATTDADTIRFWFTTVPGAGLAVRCDGWLVLDIDADEGGEESLNKLLTTHGPLPNTVEQTTPSGGRHLIFTLPPGVHIGNSTRGLGNPPGIDIRADTAGYIGVAPTVLPAGPYRWRRLGKIAEVPGWLLTLLTRPPQDDIPRPPLRLVGAHTPYGRAALEQEVHRVHNAPSGRRNTQLNESAFALGQLEAGGELAPGAAKDQLVEAAVAAKLPRAEAVRTVNSGLKAGNDSPRSAPERDAAPGVVQRRARERTDAADDDEDDPDGAMARSPVAVVQPPPQADLLDYLYTDVGNAHRFVAMHANSFRYCREEKIWLEWRGGRWQRDATGAAERAAVATVEELWAQMVRVHPDDRKAATAWALRSQAANAITAMLKLAATDAAIAVRAAQLDTHPYLLAVGNGTLDLRTGGLRQGDPADLLTRGSPVNYVPGAPCPRWHTFLGEVFQDDSALIGVVRRYYGSALTGDTRERKLFVEWGAHYNGKTTLNNAVKHVLGKELADSADIRVVMRHRTSEIPNEVARLAGKRLVVISETADGRRLDESRVKLLTGRDSVPARALYKDWFEFTPEYKLVLYTNHKPKVDSTDAAVWDRIKLIPFEVSFADRDDKDLGDKLAAEAEGILAWLVEGCLEWQALGLGTCDAIEQATAGYRDENDVSSRFVSECCELGDEEHHRIERAALRAALERYCQDNGDEPPTPVAFGRWLSANTGVGETKIGPRRAYRGIRLLEDAP